MNEFFGESYRECECCGSVSVVEEETEVISSPGQTVESIVYTCLVCGTDWITQHQKVEDEKDKVSVFYMTFISPPLKKEVRGFSTINLELPYADYEDKKDFDYFIGEKEVKKSVWYEHFLDRMSLVRSSTLN